MPRPSAAPAWSCRSPSAARRRRTDWRGSIPRRPSPPGCGTASSSAASASRPGSSPGTRSGSRRRRARRRARAAASSRKCALHGVACDQVLQMPITGRPSNWSLGMPWFFIQERWTMASRSSRPNHCLGAELALLLGDLLLMACGGKWEIRKAARPRDVRSRLARHARRCRSWSNTCTLPGRRRGRRDRPGCTSGRPCVTSDELRLAGLDQELGLRAGGLDDDDLARHGTRRASAPVRPRSPGRTP